MAVSLRKQKPLRSRRTRQSPHFSFQVPSPPRWAQTTNLLFSVELHDSFVLWGDWASDAR